MPVFQASSRSVQRAAPPKKKPRRLRREWSAVIRFVLAVSGAGGLVGLLIGVSPFKDPSNTVFILLPVFVYLATVRFQHYNLKAPVLVINMLLNSTPVYLLLTILLAVIYYGGITELELLTHAGT